MLGPVFRFELLTTARRKRYYVARVVYGLFLLFALFQEFQGWSAVRIGTDTHESMSRFAESAFVAFARAQGVALLCLVPALLAGVIADEYQRKTLHYLLASRMSSTEIVLGKLGARLLHVGVILLIGVPVVCLVALFGGLDPKEVFYIYAGTFSIVLAVSGMSLLVSVLARRPRGAILTAYALVAAWLFLPSAVRSIYGHLGERLAWIRPVNEVALASNPWNTWELVTDAQKSNRWELMTNSRQYKRYNPTTLPGMIYSGPGTGAGPTITDRFLLMIGLQTSGGLACLVLAVVGLRPLRGGGGRWERRRTVWFPTARALAAKWARPRPPCDDDDPMLWKERFTAGGGGLGWLSSRPVVLVVGAVLGAYFLEGARPAFDEFIGGGAGDLNRLTLNGSIGQVTGALYVLWLLSVASAAAMSVTAEREQDAWVSLTATLLTGPEIVRAKMRGAAWSARRLTWALLLLWGLGLVSGAVHPVGFLAAALALAVYAWFTTALGVYISLRAKNSPRALAVTLVWLLVFNVGYLVVFLGQISVPMFAYAGAMPVVEVTALASYNDVRRFLENPSFQETRYGVHSPFEIVTMYLISLAVYTIMALVLTGACFEAIDKVIERPRREGKIGPGG